MEYGKCMLAPKPVMSDSCRHSLYVLNKYFMHKDNYFYSICLWVLERVNTRLVLQFRFLCDVFPVTMEALGRKTRLQVFLRCMRSAVVYDCVNSQARSLPRGGFGRLSVKINHGEWIGNLRLIRLHHIFLKKTSDI